MSDEDSPSGPTGPLGSAGDVGTDLGDTRLPAGDLASGEGSRETGAPLVTPGTPRGRWQGWRRVALEWLTIAVVALLLAVGIRTFAFQAFFVPSASMQPTLMIGDRILVQKAFIDVDHLTTGDIVVFTRPPADTFCGANESDLVKRIIGLPHETISSSGNTVYINGHALAQPWLPAGQPLGKAIAKTTLGANEYFVMGDNRPDSCDSRYWGPIKASSIVGKVVLIWWRDGRPDFHLF